MKNKKIQIKDKISVKQNAENKKLVGLVDKLPKTKHKKGKEWFQAQRTRKLMMWRKWARGPERFSIFNMMYISTHIHTSNYFLTGSISLRSWGFPLLSTVFFQL